MIDSIGVVPLYVQDQDVYIDFYVNKLGFKLRFDKEVTPGLRWIEVGLPGQHANVGILSAAANPDKPALTNWATLTEEWAAGRERLVVRGPLDAEGVVRGAGRALRAEVERRTDELAAAPWAALAMEERDRLADLLGPLWGVLGAGVLPAENTLGIGKV
jgi:catechol 2,3-dioxygenase-like lactoylglutathione lyase family enzyme